MPDARPQNWRRFARKQGLPLQPPAIAGRIVFAEPVSENGRLPPGLQQDRTERARRMPRELRRDLQWPLARHQPRNWAERSDWCLLDQGENPDEAARQALRP